MINYSNILFGKSENIIQLNDFFKSENVSLFQHTFEGKTHILNPLPLGKNKQYVRMITISNQRTGSSMLANIFRSHSQIVYFGEIFNLNQPHWGFKKINDALLWKAQLFPRLYLKHFYFRNFSDQIKAVGFKLMYNHLKYKQVKQLLLKEFLPNSHLIIHLKRQNKLYMYISQLIARKTSVANLLQNPNSLNPITNVDIPTIKIDINQMFTYFSYVEYYEKLYDNLLQNYPLRHSIVYYEDLVKNYSLTVSKIIQNIGLDDEKLICINKKIITLPLKDFIENYDQLINTLNKSHYKVFLENE
ncbi:MAG: sulfotransferase [Bacteroidales bacterium]|nr:sulfotransferase [Bacteroidales bacterium]